QLNAPFSIKISLSAYSLRKLSKLLKSTAQDAELRDIFLNMCRCFLLIVACKASKFCSKMWRP
ncbi:MAG: hypothetical protein IJ320_07210, partial [Phascolarctobacterium sp.]|nr:hypothetical protein [Phascolarctobacterium sp.]